MKAVGEYDQTDFSLRHHIAPVAPKIMAITGVATGAAWVIAFSIGSPNPGWLALLHASAALAMILLGWVCQRTSQAGMEVETTLACVVFVLVGSSFLCLAAYNNNTGMLQSLPYCMVLTAVSGYFWPNRWGLALGSLAGMLPPFILLLNLHADEPSLLFYFAQQLAITLAVAVSLYLFMGRVRGRYLQALAELEERSRRDVLTGLYNRRHFFEQLPAMQTGGAGFGQDTHGLLIFMDIDHFKSLNDQFGHAQGDRVLRLVARALGASCAPDDLLARIGGEEFLVYSPMQGGFEIQLHAFMGRLTRALVDAHPPGGDPVTMSAGGTPMHAMENVNQALDRADGALMQAKRDGRNRAVYVGSSALPETPSHLPKVDSPVRRDDELVGASAPGASALLGHESIGVLPATGDAGLNAG